MYLETNSRVFVYAWYFCFDALLIDCLPSLLVAGSIMTCRGRCSVSHSFHPQRFFPRRNCVSNWSHYFLFILVSSGNLSQHQSSISIMKLGSTMSLFVKALMLVLISLHDGHAYTRQQCALFQLKYIFGFPFNCFDFLGDICFSGTGTAVPFNSANCMMMLPMENTWQAQNSNTAVTGYVSNHWVTVASDSGGTTCFEIIPL